MKFNIILFVLSLFLPFSLIANQIEFTPKEKAWLEKHPVINVSNENDWAPFDYTENGVAKGYSVDLIKILAKNIGIKVNFINGYTWTKLLEEFDNRNIDMMHVMTKDKERERKYSLSSPYMQWRISYFIRDNDKSINTSNDLWSGKKIASGKGWSTTTLLRKLYPKANIIDYKNTKEMLEAVSTSEVDACINNDLAVTYEMNKNSIDNVKQGGFLNLEKKNMNNFHFVSHKDSPELASIFTKAYDFLSIQENLELQNRWFKSAKDRTLLLSQKEKDYLANNTVTFTGDPNWLPFEAFDEQGDYIGIIAEHINIVENSLDVKFKKIITKNWLDTLELSKKTGADIISGDAADVVLAQNYRPIDTYIKNPLVIVTRDDHPFVSDLNYIKDKKIAFVSGYGFSADIYKKYPDINFKECKSSQDGLLGVLSGKYDAFIGTLALVDYMIVKMGIENLKISGDTGITMNLTLFVTKDKPLLHSIINKTMRSIDEIQKHKIISNWRYSKVDAVIIDYTLLRNISIVFSIILIIVLSFLYFSKRNNKKLHRLLNSTIEAIAIFKDGKLINANDTLLQMYGYSALNEIKGESASLFVSSDQHAFLKEQLKDSRKPYELNMLRKDGSIFPALIRGTNIDSNIRISSILDLTELKNTQKELERLNNSLEEKVELEVEKNRQQQLLMLHQSRLAQMGEMISMIAHQWRQPLNTLSVLNQTVILKYERDKLDSNVINYFNENANKQIQQMSKTIDDFRDFFKPEKERVDYCINDVIVNSIDMLNVGFGQYNLVVQYENSQKIYSNGFPNELGQALVNIINNAKDALVENEIVDKVLVVDLEEDDDRAIITVKDNAGGIPDNIMDKIFDPYFSTKAEKNGTGLGLYMTKLIIEDHLDGKISVENSVGGAEFNIVLKKR